MLDRKARRRIRNWLMAHLGPPIVNWWTYTLRVRHMGFPESGGFPTVPPGIYTLWHQQIFVFPTLFRGAGFKSVASRHADGELVAGLLKGLGVSTFRGSTSRGGARALIEILRSLGGDLRFTITPDGPRGPCFDLQPGAVYLASRLGCTVYPVVVSFRRSWSLPTWDRFRLPRPFTGALCRMGTPEEVPRGLDREGIEVVRKRLQEEMRHLTQDTDANFDELYARAKRFDGYRLQ